MTSRLALLALVLVVLLVSYAYPLRTWYDQRAERSALEQESDELRDSVAELEGELELWDDPTYVAAQARDRLGFVMPGEDGYIVVPEPDEETNADADAPPGLPDDGTWYQRLWGSVAAADAEAPEGDR